MGRNIESLSSSSSQKFERWLCAALLCIATSGVVWASRHTSAVRNQPAPSFTLPEQSFRIGGVQAESSVGGVPQPGELWNVIMPEGEHQAKLKVEVIEYVTVTYVRPEGKVTLPSYCLAKNLETGEIEILDFDANHKILMQKVGQK